MQITALLLAIGLLATPTVQQTGLVYCEYGGHSLPSGSQGCDKHVFCCGTNQSSNPKGPWQVGRVCNRVTTPDNEPFGCTARVSATGGTNDPEIGSVMCC
ncbi:hypothetical protein HYFRA_00008367 [Hymenoscyphus fraxineus]|uniref:Hydrophobin n=1 Tax=Hymenoscyphus fraxineus TaxID=746836 RepID=A0A9N9KQD8_9HELO|nr:hypothetical protein HYFRA_00008367 [Hymenoscyphus fraxineus]